MVGQVKFVGHDAVGLPVKRKQVNQACLPCRKRKKRCQHVPDASVTPPPEEERGQSEPTPPPRRRSGRVRAGGGPADSDASDAAAQLLRFFHHGSDQTPAAGSDDTDGQQPRQMSPAPLFLGDLNPEGILIEATMPAGPAPAPPDANEQTDHQAVGFLPPASPRASRQSVGRDRSTGSPKLIDEMPGPFFSVPRDDGSRFMIHVQDTSKFAALAQALANRSLAEKVLPSETEWNALRDIYLTMIHPIFPIYDKSTLMDLPSDASLRELIQASVCLAAATEPDAGRLLHFKVPPGPQRPVPFNEYSREVADFINKRLVELQETHQITLVQQLQVMALTCLYWQPTNPAERSAPFALYAKLIALVHTHGVHLDVPARTRTDPQDPNNRLFKCLYALDRLIGAIGARPFMLHNYDLIKVPVPDAQDAPPFRLFMALIALLDQVVELYRPEPKVTYVDIPVFEHMVIDAGALGEADSILVTLEVLYHAICVLSVRMPRHRFRTAPECDTLTGPRTQHLPPSSVNARRSHSADRILDIIKDYKLCPLPFVPYALALSLGVAYRKWRFSRLPMFRTRGGADFKNVLPVLQGMSDIWSTARINSQLGQAVVLKLDRKEIMSMQRAKRPAEAASAGPRAQALAVSRLGTEDTAGSAELNTSKGKAPGEATKTTAHVSHLPTAASALGRRLSLQESMSSPATSTLTERPPPPPSTLNIAWPADPPTSTFNSNTNNNNNIPPQPHPQTRTQQQPSTTTAPHYNNYPAHIPIPIPPNDAISLNDTIPLPADLLPPQSESQSHSQSQSQSQPEATDPTTTSPLEGLTDGSSSNLDDFLVDDDALFRAWDPRFAQSVDFSFSSILDPGNPFMWPEYCGGYDFGGNGGS